MTRPSYWILPFTAITVAAYLALPRRASAPEPMPSPRGPIVVGAEEREPAHRPSTELAGSVLDRQGYPVAGATVTVAGGGPTVTTGADGGFRLATDTLRAQDILVTAPGQASIALSVHPHEPTVVVLQPALPWTEEVPAPAPKEPQGLLAGEGFLRTGAGKAAEDGVVTVIETGAQSAADDTGRYRIALPDGTATLLAHDSHGQVARSEPLRSFRKQGLVPLPDLVLEPGLALRGYLRLPDGQAAAGSALWLRGEGVQRQVRTALGGDFSFAGLLPGTYVLEVLPHEGALGFRRPVTLQSGSTDLDLTLVAGRPLHLQVVRAADGSPVPDVWVLVEEGELRRALARADGDGRATFEGMGPGPFAFQVRAPETFTLYPIQRFDEDSSQLAVRG